MPFDSYANLQSTVLDWLARPGDPLVAPAVPDMIAMFEEEARDRLQTRFTEKTVQLVPVPGLDTIPLPLDYGELRSIWVDTAAGRRHFQYQTPRSLDMNLGLFFCPGYPAAYTIEGLNLRIVGTPVAADTTETPEGASGPTVTLTPAASATLYSDSRITPASFLGLMPETANAADALSSVWVEPGTGIAVIHHASSPNTDQTFAVSLINAGVESTTQAPGAINLDYLSGIPPLSSTAPTNWLLSEYPSAYLWGTLSYAAPYIGDDPRLQLWLSAREAAIERIRLADRRAKFPHGLMIQTDARNP
jgi:hypothetical protein